MKNKKKAAGNRWRMKDTQNSDRCWWWLASLFMVFILAVIATGCSKEEVAPVNTEEGLPATIRIDVNAHEPATSQTRAVNESAIHDLHILVYNSTGELIGKNYATTTSSIVVKTRSGRDCTIYVIANTNNATLWDGAVNTEVKLKAITTKSLAGWDELTNNTYLVMTGSKENVDIVAGSSTIGAIAVTRIAAKVTLKLTTIPEDNITIHNYRIYGLPKQTYYIARPTESEGNQDDTGNTSTGDDASKPATTTSWMSSPVVSVEAANKDVNFYMYENRRGVNINITAQKDKVKTNAPDSATYVVINGETNGYKYTWRVYLGANQTSNFNMKRNCAYTYNIKLKSSGSDTRITVTDMFEELVGGNANCYMVAPGASVNIPVERANESPLELDGSTYNPNTQTYYQLFYDTHWTAEIVWQTAPGLISISNGSGTGSVGNFTVNTSTVAGNAVVCIKSGGNILWSWHIWITPYNGSTTFKHNGNVYNPIFMDRALGAYSTMVGELSSCGLFYQWGRKDPFPGIAQYGGSWYVASDADPIEVYNPNTLVSIIKSQVPNVAPNNLTNTIRYPNVFYISISSDWFAHTTSDTRNDNLWSGFPTTLPIASSKSIYDPCPKGWRVPPFLNNTSPYYGLGTTTSFANNGGNWGSNSSGYFPASGYRYFNSGGLSGVNYQGAYWTAAPHGKLAYSLFFVSDGSVDHAVESGRADGFLLRCIQE